MDVRLFREPLRNHMGDHDSAWERCMYQQRWLVLKQTIELNRKQFQCHIFYEMKLDFLTISAVSWSNSRILRLQATGVMILKCLLEGQSVSLSFIYKFGGCFHQQSLTVLSRLANLCVFPEYWTLDHSIASTRIHQLSWFYPWIFMKGVIASFDW